jgi:4'-phosphopantetheinyl transferase EntD
MGDHPIDRLIGDALRQIAPSGVLTGARCVDDADVVGLFPVERDLVRAAVTSRQREFATGRALLRALLGERVAIPAMVSRAPQMPDGTCASLAHDADVAVAALSRGGFVRSLGVDIETKASVELDLAPEVLRPDDPVIDAALAFCVKEAVYKAWSGLAAANGTWRVLEFRDVRLDVDGDRFAGAVLDRACSGTAMVIDGRFVSVCGRWLALAVAETDG